MRRLAHPLVATLVLLFAQGSLAATGGTLAVNQAAAALTSGGVYSGALGWGWGSLPRVGVCEPHCEARARAATMFWLL